MRRLLIRPHCRDQRKDGHIANKLKDERPIERNGVQYFVRHVPKHLARLGGRGAIVWSTGITVHDAPHAIHAKIIMRQHNHKLRQHWNKLLAAPRRTRNRA